MTADMDQYKDLKGEITSENYKLLKLVQNNFSLEGDLAWDRQRRRFVISNSRSSYAIDSNGNLTEYFSADNIRDLLKNGQLKEKNLRVKNLRDLFIAQKMNSKEIYNYLYLLYERSSFFEDFGQGCHHELYFKSRGKWFFVESDPDISGVNSALGQRDVLEKFSGTHQNKEENLVALKGHREVQLSYGYDWRNKGNIVRLDDFSKREAHSDITVYLPQIPTYYEGTGYFSFKHRNETLKFRLTTEKAIFRISKYWAYIQVFSPPVSEGSELAMLRILDPMNYDNNNGLYLVRNKLDQIQTDVIEPENEFIRYDQFIESIRENYEKALLDRNRVKAFLESLSKKVINNSLVREFKYEMADYTTKLLVSRLKVSDYVLAEEIFNSYVENVIPYAGLSRKSLDVASNAMVLAVDQNREDIFQRIQDRILGRDFDMTTVNHSYLLFNLAGYYAIEHDKRNLLLATKYALLSGKKVEEFKEDPDFKDYLSDSDFLTVLK